MHIRSGKNVIKPCLRDGIDVYIESSENDICTITFVFLSTRKRIQLQAATRFVPALARLNGENTPDDIIKDIEISEQELHEFVSYLESRNIVSSKAWFDAINFDPIYKSIIEKQLYFLMDILTSPQEVYEVQSRIQKCNIAIFGIGSTGSWLLVELLQMGFQNFYLYDFKDMNDDSVTRHAFYSSSHGRVNKAEYYKTIAEKLNPSVNIVAEKLSINTDIGIIKGLNDVDLIINCADEPYIGYTSIFLSRYCVEHNKSLFVAGGFDAHLACLGEMIIPGKTPCSDCYNSFFKESLKDWKPLSHPVIDRTKGFGGLAPLSVFSASAAALSILRYFLNQEEFFKSAGGRGEFKFDDYQIDSFVVKRNENCGVCGD